MKHPAPDPLQNNEKRPQFNQLAKDQGGVKTGKAYAADLRKAGIHPVVHKLKAWRQHNKLSQRKAVAVLQKYYFHITFAPLRSWEEGRRSPYSHTAAILERFLKDHPHVSPVKWAGLTSKRIYLPFGVK